MIWTLRAYSFEGGPGLPGGRFANDHDQAVSADCVAEFLIDVSWDIRREAAHARLLQIIGTCIGWMDTEHDRVDDVTDARKPSGSLPQGDAVGKFPA
jgi:hypothetical protein